MQPKLGNVNSQWAHRDGQPVLVLQNALGLAPTAIALPQSLAMLPALCDGTRDLGALRASLMVRAGVQISESALARILEQMDQALLFENGLQASAMSRALEQYHQANGRAPISAGVSYPSEPAEATQLLSDYLSQRAGDADTPTLPRPAPAIRGILSPHIDYPRGGSVYAGVWGPATPAIRQAGLVVILGTDHRGRPGAITLTAQDYRTPWGKLNTDRDALDQVRDALGSAAAFEQELHHAVEHSVELAAVWLHYLAEDSPPPILPILCGSFAPFVEGVEQVNQHPGITGVIDALRELAESRPNLVLVAAADLAHVGPAFGGPPVGPLERAACRASDQALLEAICAGDAAGFLQHLQAERDRRNVCGIPPIYVTLRALEPASGIVTGYDQCPADAQGTSIVSIAGALLW